MVIQEEGLGSVVEIYLRRFYASDTNAAAETNMYSSVIGEVEKRLISVTLEAVEGNRLKASKILGINRNTLLRKMRLLNLDENVSTGMQGRKKRRLKKT